MAVLIQFTTLLIRIDRLVGADPDGLGRVTSRWSPSWRDPHLLAIAFMGAGARDLAAELEAMGLTLRETSPGVHAWRDICVVDVMEGPTLACEWLAYDHQRHLAWLAGTPPGAIVGPDHRHEAAPLRVSPEHFAQLVRGQARAPGRDDESVLLPLDRPDRSAGEPPGGASPLGSIDSSSASAPVFLSELHALEADRAVPREVSSLTRQADPAALLVLSGACAGDIHRFTVRARIGGDAGCELRLDDPSVAPLHAVVDLVGSGFVLRSSTGVRVNGAPAREAVLPSFAMLDVGPVTILFQKEGGGWVREATITAGAPGLPEPSSEAAVHGVIELSRSRASAAITLLDHERVLVVGGIVPRMCEGEGNRLANAEVISLTWRTTTEVALAEPRVAATATRLSDGRILIAGGDTPAVELFDPRTMRSSAVAPMATARVGASADLLSDGRVLVMGGHEDEQLPSVEIYDPARDAWDPVAGPVLGRVSAARLDAARFLVASSTGFWAPLPPTRYFLLDTAVLVFREIAAPARLRRGPSLVPLGRGRAMIVGGSRSADTVQEVDIFDVATEAHTPVADLRAPRLGGAAVSLGEGRVLVVGGDSAGVGLYSAEVYDPSRDAWLGLPPVREGLSPSTGVALGGGAAVVLGVHHVAIARGEAWPAPKAPAQVPGASPEHPPGPRVASHGPTAFRSVVCPTHRGLQHVDFFSARPEGVCVVALLRGVAPYCGDVAADVARWALATLLEEDGYGPRLSPMPSEPPRPVRGRHDQWASHLLDRSPLPTPPRPLLDALAARLHDVFVAMNRAEEGLCFSAEGVIATVAPGRVYLVRRGVARVYLVRGARATVVVHEQSVGRDVVARGMPPEEVDPQFGGIATSMFGLPGAEPDVEVATEPGDRLVFVTKEVFAHGVDLTPDDVADVTLARLITRGTHPDAMRGLGVVSLSLG